MGNTELHFCRLIRVFVTTSTLCWFLSTSFLSVSGSRISGLTVLLFVFKTCNRLACSYPSELLYCHVPVTTMKSTKHFLQDPDSELEVTTAPNLWKSLPFHIRIANSPKSFKSSLTTYFFVLAFSSTWAWDSFLLMQVCYSALLDSTGIFFLVPHSFCFYF